jgi:MFS family permease
LDKPRLRFWQIWNMSFGFLGIQIGFGLQQANMSPIYKYLGADESKLPYLWFAAPVTGLLIQPFIGAMSDRTWNRLGRRRPFFVLGAILASICLFQCRFRPRCGWLLCCFGCWISASIQVWSRSGPSWATSCRKNSEPLGL